MWRFNRISRAIHSPFNHSFKRQSLPSCISAMGETLPRSRHSVRGFWQGLVNRRAVSPALEQKSHQSSSGICEGQEIEGFTVEQVGSVPEYNLTAFHLRHLETGASYLHVDRNDPNNVFCIHFRTTPMDSTGLPHILEHMALCGSEKFPVRDPFFKMLIRSMATFMNAMTGPDYTFYPFATQNRQDYNNLMSIYLDAVFRPKLSELDFGQEGWRLEHENVDDKSSPIIIKGVVYNEMKGVYADNSQIFCGKLLNSILPSHTYRNNFGGDPLVIPSLKHSDLVSFHRHYYCPGNARFYSYGTFPLIDHLKYLNNTYLEGKPSEIGPDTAVPPEPHWKSELRQHHLYRPDPMAADPNKQASLTVSMLTADITNIQEVFELEILSELLVKGPNSPFYRTLVEPNIGAGLHPMTGLTSQTRDTFFTVGLQGMGSSDFDRTISIINSTLADVVANGFDDQRIEEVLHSVELGMRHQSSDFGMRLLYALTPLRNHDADIFLALRQSDQIRTLRKRLQGNKRYLQEKVQQYLVENSHRLVLSMSPTEDYEEKQRKAESEIISQKLESLTEEQREQVFINGLRLQEQQQKTEDVSILPILQMSDIKVDVDRHPLELIRFGKVPLQFSDQPTNGVTYFRGIFNTSHLPDHHKRLLSLFCGIAAKMGTEKHNYHEFDHLVERKTGGLSIAVQGVNHLSKLDTYEEGVLVNSYCLDDNFDEMMNLWSELFSSVKLDDKNRFKTLVTNMASNLVSGMSYSGHHYAIMSSASQISPLAQYQEICAGLTHVAEMKNIAGFDDFSTILGEIQLIAKQVFQKNNVRLAVNATAGCSNKIQARLSSFLDSVAGIPSEEPAVWTSASISRTQTQSGIHHILPSPVNFAAKSVVTAPYTDPDFCALTVLAKLLSSKYLHLNVREKGGAYGSGVSVNQAGLMNFFSYRDPQSTATLDIFDGSYEWVNKNKFTEQNIEESKLGIFQSLDAPVAPGSRGNLNFVNHISYDLLQQTRMRVKNVSRNDILEVANKYLGPESKSAVARALIGPVNKELLSRSNEKWSTVSYE